MNEIVFEAISKFHKESVIYLKESLKKNKKSPFNPFYMLGIHLTFCVRNLLEKKDPI